jgi:hypothetical protein
MATLSKAGQAGRRGPCPYTYTPILERAALVLRFVEDLCRDVGLGTVEMQHIGRLLGGI